METCVRGFSFMPETKAEVTELQYIESEELERTWKSSRRQRLKQQEQKVWEEFVKEQDVIKVVLKDDPYQFLHELPESCLKELMEAELLKTKKEVEEEINIMEQHGAAQGSGDAEAQARREEPPHAVTFADDAAGAEPDDCDMFHIFDDEKDDPSGPSGPEDEALIDSAMGSPCTVRERDSDSNSPVPLFEKGGKTSENVSQVIESSIYVAKVKDLRLKINDEILAIIASLERQDVMTIEREEVVRVCRRSAEFAARFNRIHMYQLQRQMHDVKRNTLNSLPFAKHTHFHAQMVRVASLHHHLLHAFQVFHKSVEQTACVRDSAALLHSLALAAREVSALSAAVPPPPGLGAAAALYRDEMLSSCDTLDEAVCNHSLRVSDFLSSTDNTSRSPSRKSRGKGKRKIHGAAKPSKSIADTRLSMYSLDTLRLGLNAKSSSSRDNHSSGTSKLCAPLGNTKSKTQAKEPKPKSPKKSPRHRRPLMRAGGAAGSRARARPPPDQEISTMVEAVDNHVSRPQCTSSHMSREPSPRPSPRPAHTDTPRKSLTNTPRQKHRPASPKSKVHHSSPRHNLVLKAHATIKNEAQDSENNRIQIIPVTKIQCAKNDMSVGKNFDKSNKIFDRISKKIDKGSKNISKITDKDKHIDCADKADKNSEKANKDIDSFKDLESFGNFDSKDFESCKDFDSMRDFESAKDVSAKDVDTRKDECRKDYESFRTVSSSRENRGVESFVDSSRQSSRDERDGSRSERERRTSSMAPASCDVTRLLKQLCSGDASGGRNERASGAKNAQLLCVSGGSPRQPSTPQLLRILEETIQKKAPKPMYSKPSTKDPERYRLTFNVPDKTADRLFQYRTKFVQHMLASSMYANSAVGKPWEMICSISDKLIDELLTGFAKEMQIRDIMQELYSYETK